MLTKILSSSQFEVLEFLVLGYSNKQIAARLTKSESTIKAHVKEILSRLNVTNRIQAAIIAAKFLGTTREAILKAAEEIRSENQRAENFNE